MDEYFDCFSGSTLYEAIEHASAKKKRYLIRQLTCCELREVEYRTREKIQRIKTDLRTKQIHGTGDRESEKNARAALARFEDRVGGEWDATGNEGDVPGPVANAWEKLVPSASRADPAASDGFSASQESYRRESIVTSSTFFGDSPAIRPAPPPSRSRGPVPR